MMGLRVAIKDRPFEGQYKGMPYEKLSRMAQEVCRLGAETGQTKNAVAHLNAITDEMTVRGADLSYEARLNRAAS